MGNDQTDKNNTQEKPLKIEALNTLSEWSRLLITIASGILALTVTFFRVIKAGKEQSLELSWLLVVSWALLLVSIVFGCLLVGSLVGHLNNRTINTLDAQDSKLMNKSGTQWITFLLGIGCFIAFGIFNLFMS